MDGYNMNKQCLHKPHIKRVRHGWWQCSGPSIIGMLPSTLTANGFTKEEAYEVWYKEEQKARWSGAVLSSLREEYLK